MYKVYTEIYQIFKKWHTGLLKQRNFGPKQLNKVKDQALSLNDPIRQSNNFSKHVNTISDEETAHMLCQR